MTRNNTEVMSSVCFLGLLKSLYINKYISIINVYIWSHFIISILSLKWQIYSELNLKFHW